MISHTNVYNNCYDAINALKTILEADGWTLQMDKYKFYNSKTKIDKYASIEFDLAKFYNVEEQVNNELYVNIYIKHNYNSDLDLMEFLKDFSDLFEDYTLGGAVKKCYFIDSTNKNADEQYSNSYFIQGFLIEI